MFKKVILFLAVLVLMSAPSLAAEVKLSGEKPEFEYYQVPKMIMPIITEDGLTEQVAIAVMIEMPYGKKDQIQIYEPRLVDAYIRDLYAALGSGQMLLKGNVLDVEKLKARLNAVTMRVLGEEKSKELMHEVLLQAVQLHKI